MKTITYKEHSIVSLHEEPRVFLLRTDSLDRLDVRTYSFMLDTDPQIWEHFETKKLGEICHTFLGATPKDSSADKETGVAFLKTKNVYTDYFKLEDVDYITPGAHKKRKSSSLRNGDILMTIIGASFEVIGRCVVYRDNPYPANINQNIIGIRLKDDIKLDPDFLCLQLNTVFGQMQVGQKAQRTAQFSLNKGLVEDFDIIIPHDEEQKNILERFLTIKALCNTTNEISEKTIISIKRRSELEIDRVFSLELDIDNFLNFKNEIVFIRNPSLAERLDIPANHPDYTCLVEQIKNSEFSGNLSELVNISQESFNPKDHPGSEVNYIAIGDIDGGVVADVKAPQKLNVDDLPAAARKLIRAGDILASSVRAGTEKSVVFVAGKEHDGWVCTTGFHVLKPKTDVNPSYVGVLLKSPFARFQQNSLQNRATYPTLSEDNLLSIQIPVTTPEKRSRTYKHLSQLISNDQVAIKKIKKSLDLANELYKDAVSNIFELLDDSKYDEFVTVLERTK